LGNFFDNFKVGFIEQISLPIAVPHRKTNFFQTGTNVTFTTTDDSDSAFSSNTIASSTNTVDDYTASTESIDKNRWMEHVCPNKGNYLNFTTCSFLNEELTSDCSNAESVSLGHNMNTEIAH